MMQLAQPVGQAPNQSRRLHGAGWLVPSLLVAPLLESQPPWLTVDTAPAALVAAASFFLITLWPFWPALAGDSPGGRITARWFGRSVLEVIILAAIAVPFALVAWSVAGRAVHGGPLAACAGGLAMLAMGLRAAAQGMGPRAARWLMLAAMLATVGPLAVAYAASETMGATLHQVFEAGPLVVAARLAVDGWPRGTSSEIAHLAVWPGAGLLLIMVGWWASRRRGGDG